MLLLQIVYPDGQLVRFPAGGPMEAELVSLIGEKLKERIRQNIMKRPVGFFRTEAQVDFAVTEGIEDGLQKGIEEALLTFKQKTSKGFV